MKRERYIRIYDVHSWSGLVLGLFIYVIAFTGSLALFYNELQTWEDSAKRLTATDTPALMMPALETWIDTNALNEEIDSVKFYYPKDHQPYFKALMVTKNLDATENAHEIRWNSQTGEVLAVKNSGLTDWLRDFHRHLMWPTQLGGERLGRFLVGIAGITLMLSIITGIITHTKIIKQMFELRTEGSQLLKWQDLHKVLGLWPLPFHTMVAFTGAFLGVISLLSPILAVLAFKGDTESLVAAVFGNQQKAAGIEAPMLSVDDIGLVPLASSGQLPSNIVIRNWGDQNATYKVSFQTNQELASFDSQTINGVSGKLIKEELVATIPSANRVTSSVSPLHYGNYGNIWLKMAYLILGLILCIVAASGLIVWLKRRLNKSDEPNKLTRYKKVTKLIIGTIFGLPIASIAIFHLDKFYYGAETARMLSVGSTYFIVWAGIIVFSCIRKNEQHTIHQLFLIFSALMIGIPLTNYLNTGAVFFTQLDTQQSWAWVDFSFLFIGLTILIVTAFTSYKQR